MATTVSTHAPARTASRVAAAAAALLAVALFMTVASVNVPHEGTDAEMLTWWQDSANRWSGVASGMWAFVTAVSAAVVVNYLATISAARRSPQWLAFARSMGAAVTAVWLVTGAARGAIGHLVDVMDQPLPGVDVLRTITSYNYMLLGMAGMGVLALLILSVSVIAFRTTALPRWTAYVGFVCGGIMFAAVVAQYGAYTTPLAILWSFCLAVALWREPAERS